jgi:transposase
MKKRRSFKDEFRLKVVLDALSERYTTAELVQKYQVHGNMINKWKKEFLQNAIRAFDRKGSIRQEDWETEKMALYAKIGQLEMEKDFLKKASSALQR